MNRVEHLYGRKVRRRWWSFLNWLRGYKFGAVQRCRRCDHTSPYHYGDCPFYGESWAHRV